MDELLGIPTFRVLVDWVVEALGIGFDDDESYLVEEEYNPMPQSKPKPKKQSDKAPDEINWVDIEVTEDKIYNNEVDTFEEWFEHGKKPKNAK